MNAKELQSLILEEQSCQSYARQLQLGADYICARMPKAKTDKMASIPLLERICATALFTRMYGLIAITADDNAYEISDVFDCKKDAFYSLCLKTIVCSSFDSAEIPGVLTGHIVEADAFDSRFLEMLVTAEGLLHIKENPKKIILFLAAWFGDECFDELALLWDKLRSFTETIRQKEKEAHPLGHLGESEYLAELKKHFDL